MSSATPSTSVALVSTLRDAAASLPSFLAYHRAIGVRRFYLFFDDPRDPAIDLAEHQQDIALRRKDSTLEADWQQRFGQQALFRHRDREVMARQVMNVALAVEQARQDGVDWLLHIDSDELFLPDSGSAPDHFADLDRRGIDTAVYLNLEAVVEREAIRDPFREVTLFKTNPSTLGFEAGLDRSELTAYPMFRQQLFSFYANGKSAARVTSGLQPEGVHYFNYGRRSFRREVFERPAILHYAVCGFEAFWTKYRTLGSFADQWFGQADIRSQIGPFHLDARDAVGAGDEARARRFYRERVMLIDADCIAQGLKEGLLQRIEAPARRLRRPDPGT